MATIKQSSQATQLGDQALGVIHCQTTLRFGCTSLSQEQHDKAWANPNRLNTPPSFLLFLSSRCVCNKDGYSQMTANGNKVHGTDSILQQKVHFILLFFIIFFKYNCILCRFSVTVTFQIYPKMLHKFTRPGQFSCGFKTQCAELNNFTVQQEKKLNFTFEKLQHYTKAGLHGLSH